MTPERREDAESALKALGSGKNVFVNVNPSDGPLQLTVVTVGDRKFYTVDNSETLMNREQAVTYLAQWAESTVIELTPFEYNSLTSELAELRRLAHDTVGLMPFAPNIPVSEEAHAVLCELGRRVHYPGL